MTEISSKLPPWGIHWFRRDLRVAGNPALQWSFAHHRGRVLGFFCFDAAFLSRPDFSANRFGFFLETLAELRDELRATGGDLLVLDTGPKEAFERLLSLLAPGNYPQTISFNRDYEPFARARDTMMERKLRQDFGIEVHTGRDHLLIEPDEVSTETGKFYQVYSPFARKWLSLLSQERIQERVEEQRRSLSYLAELAAGRLQENIFSLVWSGIPVRGELPADKLEEYRMKNRSAVTIPLPKAGSKAAYAALLEFSAGRVDDYAVHRDFPAVEGTSKLSVFFKNGSLSTSQVLCYLDLLHGDVKARDGRNTFLKEIIWREFYYHILYHRPEVESAAFLEKYRNISWDGAPEWLSAWQRGETGYPIVDAGMRQLNETGWMHNRVRMIVASFLTKDLHLNWQWGERYFMEKLLDGDLAPNNGGWQWAASTGCDPQPYFRIFNPLLQSKKFDPEGSYIRRYVSELRDLPAREVHEPWKYRKVSGYPRPIVDHNQQKMAALSLYREVEPEK